MGSRAGFERWLLSAVALGLLALQISAFHGLRLDDAYITYRYGQNLASGLGLVFNAGQRVQGSTSPGQMLLAALVYAVFGQARTPDVLAAIGCVAWNAQAAALYLLLARALGRVSAALLALSVAFGVTSAAFWVPLETNLAAAFVLIAFVCAQRQAWLTAIVSCGVATFVRPDGCLAAAVLLATCGWRERRRALWLGAMFASIVLPWPLFATIYYGSPVPQTAIAKFQRVGVLEYLKHELSLPGVRLLWDEPGVALTLLMPALALLGAWRLIRRERALGAFVVYGVLHAAAYLVLRPFTSHTWHLYPWTLVFCVCALAALAPQWKPQWSAVDCARTCLLSLALGVSIMRFAGECRTADSGYWTGQRDAVYRRIAAYMSAHARPGEWFASVEVGTLAYFSGLPAYDLGGLVTRHDDPMQDHPVRFIVLDKAYLAMAPSRLPVFSAQEGDFMARVYDMAPGN